MCVRASQRSDTIFILVKTTELARVLHEHSLKLGNRKNMGLRVIGILQYTHFSMTSPTGM